MTSHDNNIHRGHRRKVRDRYMATGLEGMSDHNILELLLFYAIPYKDTNPIAHRLIESFGSLSAVFKASVEELKRIDGMTENAACLVNMVLPLYAAYANDTKTEKPLFMNVDEIVDYMRPKFLDTTNERAYALCFDYNHYFIAERRLSDGDVYSTLFDMRKLASAVLETKATGVIIVHNHPSGIALPSKNDVETTKQAYEFLQSMQVGLLDHIIIAPSGHCSMIDIPRFAHIFYGVDPIV